MELLWHTHTLCTASLDQYSLRSRDYNWRCSLTDEAHDNATGFVLTPTSTDLNSILRAELSATMYISLCTTWTPFPISPQYCSNKKIIDIRILGMGILWHASGCAPSRIIWDNEASCIWKDEMKLFCLLLIFSIKCVPNPHWSQEISSHHD